MAIVYIASGFFNDRQIAQVETIKATLLAMNVDFYSPKDECVCPADAAPLDAKRILDENCAQIDAAKVVWVNPDSNDMGTLFELGYALAKGKHIVYHDMSAELTSALHEVANRSYSANAVPDIIDTSNRSPAESIAAGKLYAEGKRIVYYCRNLPSYAKFNLMLAASGIAVCVTSPDLTECVSQATANVNWARPYTGLIE
jgi:nucleoside 2-deoxyribosyltransferase